MVDAKVSAIILAGGRGRRMGEADKGLLSLRGRPLVAWVAERIVPQVDEVLVSANRNQERYGELGFPVLTDDLPDYPGPLAGLCRALTEIRNPLWLSVTCDTPFLPEDLVSRLHEALAREQADLAVAAVDGRLQPTLCLGRATLLPSLEAYVERGGRRVGEWQSGLHRVVVHFDDPAAFRNLNTPEDLAEADASLP